MYQWEEVVISDTLKLQTDGRTVRILQMDPVINPAVATSVVTLSLASAGKLGTALDAITEVETERRKAS
jgi:hypothetical protein